MKAARNVFHPDGISGTEVLIFSIRKANVKRYNAMTKKERKLAIEFIEECERYLKIFRDELKSQTQPV